VDGCFREKNVDESFEKKILEFWSLLYYCEESESSRLLYTEDQVYYDCIGINGSILAIQKQTINPATRK
jgi:hypothetical protein